MSSLVCSLDHLRGDARRPRPRVRGRKVGWISLPPFISAAAPTAVCSGVVDTPWPKAMVIELTFFHTFGSVGVATSGSSVCILSSRPMRVRNSRWPSMPTTSASLAEPMLDE